jgi:phage terminase large subunit GpA-like protein
MIEQAAPLQARRLLGGKHDLVHVKRFAGGKLALWGSGSPSKVMSEPYQVVMLDEVDQLPNFPGVGSAWALGQIRTRSFRHSFTVGGSTPTRDDQGIAELWRELSDQRRWNVACPKCGECQWLKIAQVHFQERKAETAAYYCESCGVQWSDGERAAAVFRGEYRSMLEPQEALRRAFAGFHISRLYDPYMPIVELAANYLRCVSEHDLQVFYNSDLGEPYTPSTMLVTDEDIQARATMNPGDTLPADVQFITAGVDVQAGLTFYTEVDAWTLGAVKYVLHPGIVRGWERLREFLRGFQATTAAGKKLGIVLTGIDSGYETSQVYNFCQAMGANTIVPTRYGNVQYGARWNERIIATARNIKLFLLERPYWMDRAIGRFGGGEELAGVVLPVGISDEYKAHVMANRRVETIDPRSGYRKTTWELPKGMRDDYIQAAVNAEFAAVLCGLDALQTRGAEFKAARHEQHERVMRDRDSWIRRDYRVRGKWLTPRR